MSDNQDDVSQFARLTADSMAQGDPGQGPADGPPAALPDSPETLDAAQPVPAAGKGRRVTRKQFLIGSAALIVALAGISVGAIETAVPHYKQAWCSRVIATLDETGVTQAQYESDLAAEGTPTHQLLSDIQVYDLDNVQVQSADDVAVLGDIATTIDALDVVGSDLRQIDRRCGVPVAAARHQGI